jgi:hypothetical protein
MSFFYLDSYIHTRYMDSDDEVQEIDPSMFTCPRRKKYRRRILIAQLDERFCRRSKRSKNKLRKSIDQNIVDGVDVLVTTEVQNCRRLHFYKTGPYFDYHIEAVLFYLTYYN